MPDNGGAVTEAVPSQVGISTGEESKPSSPLTVTLADFVLGHSSVPVPPAVTVTVWLPGLVRVIDD